MYKFSLLLKHSKMISVTFLVGFLFNCSGSNSSDEFVQEISIKFSASKTNIVLGDSTILSWATETGANCIAGDGWTGNNRLLEMKQFSLITLEIIFLALLVVMIPAQKRYQ